MTTDTEAEVDEVVDDLAEDAEPDAPADILERLSQHVYFVGDQLHVDDRDLVETRLVRQRWSPSSALSLNDGCASKWAIEKLLPRSADPRGAAEQGTAGHWVLETLFGLPFDQRTIERVITIIDAITPEKNPDLAVPGEIADRYMWRSEVLGKILGLWTTEDPTKVYAVGRETRLDTVSVGGVPFIGIVDRTVLDSAFGRTGIKVSDYKTGNFPNTKVKGQHHADQARLYHLAYTALHGVEPVGGEIIYTQHAKVSPIDMSRPELDRVEKMFADTYHQAVGYAEAGVYPTMLNMLCGWCPFTTVCPTARIGGRSTAKTTGAKTGTELGIRVLPAPTTAVIGPDPDLDLPDSVSEEDPDSPDAPAPSMEGLPVDAAYDDPTPPEDPWADWPVEAPGIPTSVEVEANQEEEMSQAVRNDEATEPVQQARQASPAMWSGGESKRWETNNPDQTPNPDSAAASGVFGVIDMALKQLQLANVKMTLGSAKAVSQTLILVVDHAERAITRTGNANLGDGLNTRLRGALYSHLEQNPLPFGEPVEAWDAWVATAETRVKSIGKLGFLLMTEDLPVQPWAGDSAVLLHQPLISTAVETPHAAA